MGRSRDEGGSLRHAVLAAGIVAVLAVALALCTVLIPERGERTATDADVPALTLQTPAAAGPVLADSELEAPKTTGLTALEKTLENLLKAPGFGRSVGFAMAPLAQPVDGWRWGARAVTPASTMKLLTTTAALSVLGPEHRFVTSTVRGAAPDDVILVGGGDPLLAVRPPPASEAAATYPRPATLHDLAQRTAARLIAAGVSRVHLGYDAALFTGPAVNPKWPPTYVPENVVSPIQSLWVNEGRERPGLAQRSANPSLAAALAFRNLLRSDGVQVNGQLVPRVAAGHPTQIAQVESAPLREIVQHILELSDNEGAEVLLRQVALARGLPGSSAAGVSAVRATLLKLGLDLRGALFYDGSGLSRDDVVPVRLLLSILELDSSPAHPSLRGVVTGLPVAGFSGSLAYRFVDDAPAGDGYVRAKTGTLTGVDGLAGIAETRTGVPLVFVAVADAVPVPSTLAARGDLDAIAAAVAQCGCGPG